MLLLTPNGRNQYLWDKPSPIVVYWNKQLLLIVASPQTVLSSRISFFYFCSNLCYITLRLCIFYTSIYSNNSLLNVKIGQYLIISVIWYRQFYVVGFFIAVMWYRTKYRSLTFRFISVCSGVVVPLKDENWGWLLHSLFFLRKSLARTLILVSERNAWVRSYLMLNV